MHSSPTQSQWDHFVLAHGGNFLQSWGWSEFQKALGRKVFRTHIDDTQGERLLQFFSVAYDVQLGIRYLSVPRGPIFRRGIDLSIVRTSVLELMNREGAHFAKVELPFTKEEGEDSVAQLAQLGFVPGSHREPLVTRIADLTLPEHDLLSAMHHKTRYNIRVAERHGVTVREVECYDAKSCETELATFLHILNETATRDSFSLHPKAYYHTMMQVLGIRPQGLAKDDAVVKLFFAEKEGEVLAAGLFMVFGDTVTYLHGASKSEKRELMAPYVLHWQVMLWAKQQGLLKYDFWGIAPTDDVKHPWAGLSRFKNGFGGKRVEYAGAFELPRSKFWYRVYALAKKVK